MNIAQLLLAAARAKGERPALCIGPEVVATYADLAASAAGLAAALRGRFGLQAGDRVGIVMTNTPAYLEVLFGIWWGGLVAVPINARLHAREVSYILASAGTKVCFTNKEVESVVGSIAVERDFAVVSVDSPDYARLAAHDPIALQRVEAGGAGWLFYTSGTTGRPKGATLTHRNLMAMLLGYLGDITHVTTRSTILHAAPLSHGTGLMALPYVAKAAANVVLESRSLDHDEVLELLGRYRGVTMYHTPTMLKRLVNHPALAAARLENLDTVFYGGSPMYLADLHQAIDRLGPRLAQMWAQAETPNTGTVLDKHHHADTTHPRYLERLSSAGIARTGIELRIGDENDDEVGAGALGEILVRGDTVMAGYWDAPEATAETLRNGWLHTGDLGSMDKDGFLTIKDRAKDMIISGGFNIYPREIEEVLQQHPAVLEVSVFGRPHHDLVEEVVACIVARPGMTVTDAELDALCLDNIARFKRPRAYHRLQELPKSYYGKILKRELRETIGAESDSALAERRQ
ncbi:MAG: AMP-binding protein [Reyranellaceae bacterium]